MSRDSGVSPRKVFGYVAGAALVGGVVLINTAGKSVPYIPSTNGGMTLPLQPGTSGGKGIEVGNTDTMKLGFEGETENEILKGSVEFHCMLNKLPELWVQMGKADPQPKEFFDTLRTRQKAGDFSPENVADAFDKAFRTVLDRDWTPLIKAGEINRLEQIDWDQFCESFEAELYARDPHYAYLVDVLSVDLDITSRTPKDPARRAAAQALIPDSAPH